MIEVASTKSSSSGYGYNGSFRPFFGATFDDRSCTASIKMFGDCDSRWGCEGKNCGRDNDDTFFHGLPLGFIKAAFTKAENLIGVAGDLFAVCNDNDDFLLLVGEVFE